MASLQRDFPFRRYLVRFQGTVSGAPNGCDPPIPTIRIGCTANLQLVETVDTVSCEQQGSGLVCTGEGLGQVLVDCVARDNLNDLTTGLRLDVDMRVPSNQDFQSCTNVDSLAQLFGVGIVCPDNSVSFDTLACDPITSFVPGEIPTCFSRCSGDCTDPSDLPNVFGEVLSPGSCLWEPEDVVPTPTETPEPPETPAPTSAPVPVSSPAPTSSPATARPTTSSNPGGAGGPCPASGPGGAGGRGCRPEPKGLLCNKNGVCDTADGETKSNCPEDCGECPGGASNCSGFEIRSPTTAPTPRPALRGRM